MVGMDSAGLKELQELERALEEEQRKIDALHDQSGRTPGKKKGALRPDNGGETWSPGSGPRESGPRQFQNPLRGANVKASSARSIPSPGSRRAPSPSPSSTSSSRRRGPSTETRSRSLSVDSRRSSTTSQRSRAVDPATLKRFSSSELEQARQEGIEKGFTERKQLTEEVKSLREKLAKRVKIDQQQKQIIDNLTNSNQQSVEALIQKMSALRAENEKLVGFNSFPTFIL